MPALKYVVAEYTFKRTFVFVSSVLINYFTHVDIPSCGLLLQLNDNNWVRVFFYPHEFYIDFYHPSPTHGRGILRLGFIYHLPKHPQKGNEDLLNPVWGV